MTVSAIDSALRGIGRSHERLNRAASSIANPESGGEHLVEDVVDLKLAEREQQANLTVLKRVMEMDEHVLDILA
ncbi:MAG: hypothetical protein IT350_04765 [Deltaproteobacteria bacterium]|nr:hypothetical protein [Deltaproteobacteria bacterium]